MDNVNAKDINWKDLRLLKAGRSSLRPSDHIVVLSSETKRPYRATVRDLGNIEITKTVISGGQSTGSSDLDDADSRYLRRSLNLSDLGDPLSAQANMKLKDGTADLEINSLKSKGNIEINGTGWGIFPNRLGVGNTPTITSDPLQVYGDVFSTGAYKWWNPTDSNVDYVMSSSGSSERIAILRNYDPDSFATLLEIRSKAGDPTSDTREATLALTRTDDSGNAEFIDFFNNGYHSNSDDLAVTFGINIQRRGSGIWRPFKIGYDDGNTYTNIITINPPSGLNNAIVRVDASLEANLDVGGVSTFNDSVVMTNGTIGTDNFVSQLTGWRGTYAGEWDVRYLFTDELRARAFTADVAQALAGSDFLTKSVSKMAQEFTVPANTTSGQMIVDDLEGQPGIRVFEDNDWIRLRVFDRSGGGLVIADVWGTVVLDTNYGTNGFASDNTQAYTFTTQDDGSVAGQVIHVGSIVLDYGQSGDGFIERTVLDAQGAPYAQVVTWDTDPSNNANYTLHTRLGVLDGIQNASGAGLYGENTFLTNSLLAGDLTKSGEYMEYSGGTLTVKGQIQVIGGSGLGSFSDANTSSLTDDANLGGTSDWSGVNDDDGNKPANNATVGADWNSNLSSIPDRFNTDTGNPPVSGLYLTAQFLGYWNNSTTSWDVFIANDGQFGFNGDANNYITWNGTTLEVSGVIQVLGGNAETTSGAQAKVNSLKSDLDDILDNAVTNGTTIISGGFIQTNLIDVDDIFATNANVTATLTMGTNGEITNTGGDYTIDESGINLAAAGGKLQNPERRIEWSNGAYVVAANSSPSAKIFFGPDSTGYDAEFGMFTYFNRGISSESITSPSSYISLTKGPKLPVYTDASRPSSLGLSDRGVLIFNDSAGSEGRPQVWDGNSWANMT